MLILSSDVLVQHLRVVDYQKLVIFPPDMDRAKLYYAMQTLRGSLKKVIVKVSCFNRELETLSTCMVRGQSKGWVARQAGRIGLRVFSMDILCV